MRYERLKNMREDRDLKQNQLAAYLSCTQGAYSHYENGTRGLPADVIVRLAAYYSCSADYLLGLTDIKEPYPATAKKSRKK